MKVWTYIAIAFICLLGFIIVQLLIVKYSGTAVPALPIPRDATRLGSGGDKLKYVILGDSTAVAQGSKYAEGYAMATAEHLAKKANVTLVNKAVTGATAADVASKQLSEAVAEKPDIVLVAVGPNDVTHLTSGARVKKAMTQTIDGLIAGNCDVKIVLTGSADMGAVPRFPRPLRWLAGKRTQQLNTVFERLVAERNLTFAPIAKETGPRFRANPGLFAADKFHPTAEGYGLWTGVINPALDDALKNQPSHCE